MRKNLLLLMACVLLPGLSGCMMYSTGSTEVGVRTVKWSLTGAKGVEDKVYPPGSSYFFLPFLNDWHTFDTRLQNLEMTAVGGRGERQGRDDLLFKSIDGNDISLDVIISYRIDPARAPMILQKVATSDETLKECIVRTITRSKPRDIFGELDTEEFYIAEKRSEKAEEVAKTLNEMMAPYGIIVERVGTRDYRFNPDYQLAIEEKKVADQEAQRLRAETSAREEEYRTLVQKAQAEIEKIRVQADGEYQRAVIEADAYHEQQERLAQAIIAEGRAEAEAVREMNRALSGPGGENMVKLELAHALLNKQIVMLPMGGGGLDVRSTDINSLLEVLGLRQLAQQAQRPRESQPGSGGGAIPLQRPQAPAPGNPGQHP